MSINNIGLEQKVDALREEVGEIKERLKTFLTVSNISIEDALLNARRITEYVVNDVIEKENFEARRDLMDNLETLGSRDEKSKKRRNGKEPILPNTIYSSLHNLRIYGNSIAHPFEPGTTKLKNIVVSSTDIQIALGHLLRIVEWFFSEYEKGPSLCPLFKDAESGPFLGRLKAYCNLSNWRETQRNLYEFDLEITNIGKTNITEFEIHINISPKDSVYCDHIIGETQKFVFKDGVQDQRYENGCMRINICPESIFKVCSYKTNLGKMKQLKKASLKCTLYLKDSSPINEHIDLKQYYQEMYDNKVKTLFQDIDEMCDEIDRASKKQNFSIIDGGA